MDIIFKIAGWMILIIIALVALTALVNAWPDIKFFLSDLFGEEPEEEDSNSEETDQFEMQIFHILKQKGRYDNKQKLRIYNDDKITIYEDKRILWKVNSKNPRKDCLEHVKKVYISCMKELQEKEKSS